jgi:3-methyladenine DNA glycosylase AlkD
MITTMSQANLTELTERLRENSDAKRAENFRRFFKNCKDDIFLGVPAATIRMIAKEFASTSLENIRALSRSKIHDERSLAHALLCLQFKKGNEEIKTNIFNFYLENRQCIKDWDAVDDTAPYIVGPYLLHKDKSILYELTSSQNIWDRRIAIVSTLHFVRKNHIDDALQISKLLLNDKEDLIHKAVGWVLREVGKKDLVALINFLNEFQQSMPRTMLRYAIEKFQNDERQQYLLKSRKKMKRKDEF